MEKEKFEDSWKKAFDQAELNPSENVWTNIELDLEKARGVQLRKRLMFYQLLAAASILFSIGIGISIYVLNREVLSSPIDIAAKREIKPSSSAIEKPEKKSESASLENASKTSISSETTSKASKESVASVNKNEVTISTNEGNDGMATVSAENVSKVFSPLRERPLPVLVNDKTIALVIPDKEQNADPVALMLARLDDREKEIAGEEKTSRKSKNENLWTSVGVSAGSFNSLNAGVTNSSVSNQTLASAANQQAKASGQTYSMGVNMGTKLANRWVLQGGVNYLTQSSDYTAQAAVTTTNFTSFRPASVKELEKGGGEDFSTKSVVSTAKYNVNNNIRYLTIPMQAGFLVINRDFGMQLNAGLATDLFLQNTVTAAGSGLDKTSQGKGQDSPYRAVNFSGLMGTEFSYRFSKHYRIALNPGLRYPINNIYKTGSDVKASPLTLDIGLRFRYIFH